MEVYTRQIGEKKEYLVGEYLIEADETATADKINLLMEKVITIPDILEVRREPLGISVTKKKSSQWKEIDSNVLIAIQDVYKEEAEKIETHFNSFFQDLEKDIDYPFAD